MGMTEIWLWLGTGVEYLMAIFAVTAAIFFFIAIISKKRSHLFGFLSGISAIGMFLCLVLGTTGNILHGLPKRAYMGTFQVTLSIIFITSAVVFIYFAYDAKNTVGDKDSFYSTFLMAIVTLVMGIYMIVPSLIVFFGAQDISTIAGLIPYYTLTFPFPIARVIMVVVPLIIFAIGIYVLKEMKSKKYLSEHIQEEVKLEKTYSRLDLEISRKIYHVLIIVVIIGYLFVGRVIFRAIYNFTFNNLPQPPEMPLPDQIMTGIIEPYILNFRAGHLLFLMAGSWIFLILLFTDIIRIKKYRYYPIKTIAKLYRDKERFVLAPHVYLTTGVLFALMLSDAIASYLGDPTISAHIVTMTLIVSAIADAIATIIGITKGKHHLKGGKSKKTWEGWIAGVVSAFILGFLSYIILMTLPEYGGNIGQAIVLSLVVTAVFGFIDYFSPPIPISDNLLNPIAISLALWGVALIFFI
ncbi:MAG: hypothetical protein ACFFD2_11270 [Promethearchaeota archaeon]